MNCQHAISNSLGQGWSFGSPVTRVTSFSVPILIGKFMRGSVPCDTLAASVCRYLSKESNMSSGSQQWRHSRFRFIVLAVYTNGSPVNLSRWRTRGFDSTLDITTLVVAYLRLPVTGLSPAQKLLRPTRSLPSITDVFMPRLFPQDRLPSTLPFNTECSSLPALCSTCPKHLSIRSLMHVRNFRCTPGFSRHLSSVQLNFRSLEKLYLPRNAMVLFTDVATIRDSFTASYKELAVT